jgi:hypothetical protein
VTWRSRATQHEERRPHAEVPKVIRVPGVVKEAGRQHLALVRHFSLESGQLIVGPSLKHESHRERGHGEVIKGGAPQCGLLPSHNGGQHWDADQNLQRGLPACVNASVATGTGL